MSEAAGNFPVDIAREILKNNLKNTDTQTKKTLMVRWAQK